MGTTYEQKVILDSLKCVRLSSDEIHLRTINTFFNEKNDSIAEYLRNDAYSEDENNVVACYLVKDSNDNILFFFSLKCGMLYDQYLDSSKLQYITKLFNYLDEISTKIDASELPLILNIKEKIRSHKGLTKADFDRIPKLGNTVIDDLEVEFNKNITHVGKTYSGIEIIHFCSNTTTINIWDSFGFQRRMGEVIFWKFIVPKVTAVMKIVGCEYLFLFAADMSNNESLIRYYRDLDFHDSENRATAKPVYDLSCKFMYQRTNTLEVRMQEFFNHFND